MATIDDIAAAANVSNTTVSNVINGKTKRVSSATVERVNKIISELGYVPNMSARALVSNSSKVVALIHLERVPKSMDFLDDPFTSRLASAVELALRESGYYLMLRTVSDADDLLAFLRHWNVDGLFLTGVFEDDEICSALRSINKPIVLCDSYLSDYGNMVNVGLKDVEGARLATRCLISAGHTRIAFASPPVRPGGVVEKRLLGYKQTLEESGIPFDSKLLFVSEFSTQEASRLGASIAMRGDITAVFATADLLAAGIMAGIRLSGKRVPDDFSIVGFDDLNWCLLTSPNLTTVRQNTRLKGQLAADLMVSMLENGVATAQNITLPVYLVERASVKTLKVTASPSKKL
ncbi:MAG: LacI family transcriptional regulator [Clostridiales bacterium]|nr:LacI family transcriptional regulator [Clostridiales bacterium]